MLSANCYVAWMMITKYFNSKFFVRKMHCDFINDAIRTKVFLLSILVKLIGVKQGWPHFLCSGQKNKLKELGGQKNVSKKAWWAKFYLVKTHNRASLTF